MQKYIGVKIVGAEPMSENTFRGSRGRPLVGQDQDGYLVHYYSDGYESWCPKTPFEKANRPTDAMPFGHAIEAAKLGKKIARKGWNGKDMFVVYMEPLQLKFIGEDTPLDCQPYFAMFNAQKQWIPGWLASQSDMLADDWMIVGEDDVLLNS